MKKRTAILIDGGFLSKKIGLAEDAVEQASRLAKVANLCIDRKAEELYRIFYYDCAPYERTGRKLDGSEINFAEAPRSRYQKLVLHSLGAEPFFAIRLGSLRFRGWSLKKALAEKIRQGRLQKTTFKLSDFAPNFQQKGVDMRIGLDVALLAIHKLVDRVVLVTGDLDFIPAMKLARREGLQVVLADFGGSIAPELIEHSDLQRRPNLSGIQRVKYAEYEWDIQVIDDSVQM